MPDRLLLIENDERVAETLRLHLEESGFYLHREADGQEALACIEREVWDLVLLAVERHGADGWDICRHLHAQHPAIPVIMLSTRASESDRVLGLELGADDFIEKPFSTLELVARVRALIRRSKISSKLIKSPTNLYFGAYLIDARRRELQRDSDVVPLTLREFDLLSFLARHHGHTHSRQHLLDKVWGDSFDGYEHTVNSHINRLRVKIEQDPRKPKHIQTVWGIGYRFDAGAVHPRPTA
jgi:DNA-binding response OmpR family regulator